MRLLVCILLSAVAAFGQTAQITGRLSDPSGAVIPGAAVTITNIDTGIERRVSTNESGYYTLSLLPPGKYRVNTQAQGFKTITRESIELAVDQVLRLDFAMELGQVTEAVEVKGTVGMVDASSTSVSTVIQNQKILDLPLVSRNPIALADLVPGVRSLSGFGGTVSTWSSGPAAIGGGTPNSNSYLIDGIPNEAFISGGMNTFLAVDATEEFRIITRNANAEYGRTGGGIINLISKSGTNQFHGSAFEFFRNKVLNANGFFANRAGRARAPFNFNQYGATIGGPIVRNRTFFFANWESYSQHVTAQAFRTVPTDLQRRGDFSQTRDAAGRLITIYDPYNTTQAANGSLVRQPFPGNVIPAARIHPAAKAIMGYFPAPNLPGLAFTAANNYFAEAAAPTDKNMAGIKIDHNFTPERRLSGRFTYDKTVWVTGNPSGNIADPSLSDMTMQRRSVALHYTDALRPDFLFEARAGFNRYAAFRPTRSYGFDVTTIGLPASLKPQLQIPRFPSISFSDVSALGPDSNDHARQANEGWSGAGIFTKYRGKQTLKFGVEERVYRLPTFQSPSDFQFSFSRGFTQGPNPLTPSSTAGYGFASLLLGTPGSGSVKRFPSYAMQAVNSAAFVQDDWKVRPRLTLNLGLRWELEGAVTDRFNSATNFDPNLMTQAGGVTLRGGAVFPGVNGVPRGIHDNSYRQFGPRFGFAYQPLAKTSIRGGFGVYYLPGTGVFTMPRATGFDLTTNMVTSVEAGVPYDTLTNPYPQGIQMPDGSRLGGLTALGSNLAADIRSQKSPYSLQWNVNVQRDLPGNWFVEGAYLGNHGVHLTATRYYGYTVLTPEVRALGPKLLELVANPYAGLIQVGVLSQPQIQRAYLLRRYPQFASVWGLDNWANSIYHAGTLRVEKRFSRGFSALIAYTFSKLIDDSTGSGQSQFLGGGAISTQDFDNLRAERAISTSDIPQRLVLTSSWQPPVARKGNRIYRVVLGGWQLNSILTLQSGNPLAIRAPAPAYSGTYPNVVGDPNAVAKQTIDRWFNTGAFKTVEPYTMGNGPRNLPRTRTDGLFNWDFSTMKDFTVREGMRLQFRAEFFNFTNTVTFGTPGSSLNTATFSVVSSEASTPRRAQFGLKLYF